MVEVDRKRAKFQEAFAADAMTLPELKAYLAQVDETRKTAERELEILRESRRIRTRSGGRSGRAPRFIGSTGA
jgi:hypothetical protein